MPMPGVWAMPKWLKATRDGCFRAWPWKWHATRKWMSLIHSPHGLKATIATFRSAIWRYATITMKWLAMCAPFGWWLILPPEKVWTSASWVTLAKTLAVGSAPLLRKDDWKPWNPRAPQPTLLAIWTAISTATWTQWNISICSKINSL